jgi:hypothetical protein
MPSSNRRKSTEKHLAQAEARVSAARGCTRLVHIEPLDCGCDRATAVVIPLVTAPAPSPGQLSTLVERVDVTAERWPYVRAALTAALEGGTIDDPNTRRELGDLLAALPTVARPADAYPGIPD